MRFRPCIDLRQGRVVQIVGSSLRDDTQEKTITNFETERSSADYARMYQADGLTGGHVIALGPGNHQAALAALKAFPGGLQMGGGITPQNAREYLEAGASHVIVTSYVFHEGQLDWQRLNQLVEVVGRERLVLDLSCRQRDRQFWVHGVDVEGLRVGIDEPLVQMLGEWSPLPVTYAGGAKTLADLERVKILGQNKVDLTIGSALDIFGGNIKYQDVVAWQQKQGQN
jgi:phosphoribosylformimino-5-aminoimidazole carboxamide ribotide isomerase